MNSKTPIRVLLADDHPIFRDGVGLRLSSDPEVEVVGQAGSGTEAIRMATELRPDVLLVDVSMPDIEGPEVVEACKAGGIECAYVFLTMHKYPALLRKAIGLGVRGYVLKDSGAAEVLEAVKVVARGGEYLSAAVSALLMREIRVQGDPEMRAHGIGDLTPVQRKVLRLVATDRTSKEIAEEMGLSVRTVENHRARICKKLGLSGAHSLVKFAFEHQGEF